MLDMYPKVSNVTEYISLEDRVIFKTIVERRNKQEIYEAMWPKTKQNYKTERLE
jgi:hypothetical protein